MIIIKQFYVRTEQTALTDTYSSMTADHQSIIKIAPLTDLHTSIIENQYLTITCNLDVSCYLNGRAAAE
ncbi:MAG: hypothetical protein SO011_02140 [Prevotella sp.]|nr:hypothetical protein [Prevotella sp.]